MRATEHLLVLVFLGLITTMSGQEAKNRCLVSLPTYPPLARQARIQGQVIVKFEVDKDGNVVTAASDPVPGEPRGISLLRPEAVTAVRSWKLTPAGPGDPATLNKSVIFDFKLKGEEKTEVAYACPQVTFDSFKRVEIVATAGNGDIDNATGKP